MPFYPEPSRGLSVNAMVKALRHFGASRHNQRKSPFFVVEGYRVCREALMRQPSWFSFCLLSEPFAASGEGEEIRGLLARLGYSWGVLSQGEFSGLALTEGSQGVMVAMERPVFPAPRQLSPVCTLILDQVREPGNVGTLLRTAWAAGLGQVWFTAGSADPWNPKVIRSGMGAQFALETHLFPDLPTAAEAFRALGGKEIWCAMMEAPTTLFSPEFSPAGAALVLGNEGNGITCPQAGRPVTIPMPGHAESLNVAQAGTLLLFEALRRLPFASPTAP